MPFNLYPKNSSKFDASLFANPTAEYRGTPFWSWNNRLDKKQLLRQLDGLAEMGFGGAHLHCRTGLDTPYLGKEFMQIVKACTEYADKKGLLTWLYDEDRWPSGAAGGIVTKNKAFRACHLLFTPTPYDKHRSRRETLNVSAAHSGRSENGRLLARYEVRLDSAGALANYRRLMKNDKPATGTVVWHAYLETANPSDWFNHQTYVDTLNPKAIAEFVRVTHEAYRRAVGKHFGKTVPAIFTDEPQFARKTLLARGTDQTDVVLPWTPDLGDSYARAYNEDILDTLPELVWEKADASASVARYRYHDHVAERFSSAFADTLGNWCRKNRIALTGHMMEEPTLETQTHALGEAMRSYRAFDIPGIDMLCDGHEYTTAKQAQSAAHQYGCPGVMSELYGVTGWHFDFVGHKAQGDWQAALGVTVRVPHLAWVSMAGEAKRDYPAAIGHQSPWFREYPLVEDHFSRVNVALTRGKPLVRVGVIHPIESFWLCYGPHQDTQAIREQREWQFRTLTDWLLFGTLDFDFICESLLPSQKNTKANPGKFHVGEMAYDVILVPGMRTIRSTTLQRLEEFAAAGGSICFVGEVPSLVDAVASDRPARLAGESTLLPFERVPILDALDSFREVRTIPGPYGYWGDEGGLQHPMLYQMRQDGSNRYVFFCNTERRVAKRKTTLAFRGHWKLTRLDTFTGKSEKLAATYKDGWTSLRWDAPAHGSLLLEMKPGEQTRGGNLHALGFTEISRLPSPVAVTLSEPNVLLLDQAEWRLNGGKWNPREEILRIDDAARKGLGLPLREGHMAQPWTDTRKDPVAGMLELRFTIDSAVNVPAPALAIEEANAVTIQLDGVSIPKTITGWWVDEAIQTIALPPLSAGVHELLITIPMTRKRNVEWCYLLGDFGVHLAGTQAQLRAPVRTLGWGDWTTQGLPFYAGNVTYHCPLPHAVDERTFLEARKFSAPLLTVDLAGQRIGPIAFDPFRLQLAPSKKPAATLDITAYGNRANAFGKLHNSNELLRWYGPDSWRSKGSHWCYEYLLHPMGILTAPILLRRR